MSDSENSNNSKSYLSNKLNNMSNKLNKNNIVFFLSGFSTGILATITYSKYFLKRQVKDL